MRRVRSVVRGLSGVAMVGVLVVVGASPAGAHVTLAPGEATAGGFVRVAMRVPTERDVPTVEVQLVLPEDSPFGSVRVQPVPGWTHEIQRRTLDEPIEVFGEPVSEVVSAIVWSGGTIAPDEFMEFPVSIGPLPADPGILEFDALQTYEGGEIVRWIDPPSDDGEDPEHPSPLLTLIAADGDDTDDAGDAPPEGDVATDAAAPGDSSDDGAARALGIVGIALGALALVVAVLSARRGRAT